MTAQQKQVDRKVVPRWHSLSAAARQGEFTSLRERQTEPTFPSEVRDQSLRHRIRDWEHHRSPAFAADLVAAALVLGSSDEALEAARYLAEADSAPLGRKLARRLLGEEVGALFRGDDIDAFDSDEARLRIQEVKKALVLDPRTALLWGELARWYAAIGQKPKASESMGIALALTPDDRFLLRSAARLDLHLDDPERAHRLLTRSELTRFDPWLAAAEVAIAPLAGKRSRFMRQARKLLASGQFRPIAVSELASALATEELGSGSLRNARRLFRASLDHPTENAVAQAEWASRRGGGFEFDQEFLNVEDSYEARAQFFAQRGDVDRALQSTWGWLREQPFASVPAIFGSYEAAIVRRYEDSIRFAKAGLVANPSEFLLRNNLVFALASSERLDEAGEHLALIDPTRLDEEQRVVFEATTGLLAFRRGDAETGRRFYAEAINRAQDPAQRAIAAILWAREEIVARTPNVGVARREAKRFAELARQSNSAREERIPLWLDHIEEAVAAGTAAGSSGQRGSSD